MEGNDQKKFTGASHRIGASPHFRYGQCPQFQIRSGATVLLWSTVYWSLAPVIYAITWITTHFPTSQRWKAKLA